MASRLEGFSKGQSRLQSVQKTTEMNFHRCHHQKRVCCPFRLGTGRCIAIRHDGFRDLFVTYYGKNVLYHNNGDGTFTDVSEKAGVAGTKDSLGEWLRIRGLRPRRASRFVCRHYIDMDLATAPVPESGHVSLKVCW